MKTSSKIVIRKILSASDTRIVLEITDHHRIGASGSADCRGGEGLDWDAKEDYPADVRERAIIGGIAA